MLHVKGSARPKLWKHIFCLCLRKMGEKFHCAAHRALRSYIWIKQQHIFKECASSLYFRKHAVNKFYTISSAKWKNKSCSLWVRRCCCWIFAMIFIKSPFWHSLCLNWTSVSRDRPEIRRERDRHTTNVQEYNWTADVEVICIHLNTLCHRTPFHIFI